MRKVLAMLKDKNGDYSLRRVLAVLAFLGIMDCTHYGIRNGLAVEVVGLVGVLAGLVAAMLGLTTFQNIKQNDNSSNTGI
jgi:hypothetical protein